jgi:hypothetical protein
LIRQLTQFSKLFNIGLQLWAGNPATCVRSLTKTEMADFEPAAHKETDLAEEHKAEFLPYTTVYQQAEQLGVADPVCFIH